LLPELYIPGMYWKIEVRKKEGNLYPAFAEIRITKIFYWIV
jgi:hypothetical protein